MFLFVLEFVAVASLRLLNADLLTKDWWFEHLRPLIANLPYEWLGLLGEWQYEPCYFWELQAKKQIFGQELD